MSIRQHQLNIRIGVTCSALFAPMAMGCGAQSLQEDEGEFVVTSPAALAASQRNCGVRFVAPNGSDNYGRAFSNHCRSRHLPCHTINHAVDVACVGDEVFAARGDYSENVIVTKSVTLVGTGSETVLYPALSSPHPCDDSSLCDGQSSNVITIRSSNVTVRSLVIDGDNPLLTSGAITNGADIDARNGIIVDYLAGNFDALTVTDVVVKNIYFRGIAAVSGGSFAFGRNYVRNVAGDSGSVAILNFGGSGTITGNAVDASTDAIASNHSTGVVISHNHVTNCTSGIHTDNAGDSESATADRIISNRVSSCKTNGYGIYTFAPYVAPVVRGNSVDGCAVGLAALGQAAAVTPLFADNRVDARGTSGSVGAYITTSLSIYGSSDVTVDFVGNAIHGTETGVLLQQEAGRANASSLSCNRLERNGTGIVSETATSRANGNSIHGNEVGVDGLSITSGSFDATMNWWGCAAGPSGIGCDSILGNVDAASPLDRPPSARRCAHGRRATE